MSKPEFPACESCSTRHLSIFEKLAQDELVKLSASKGCNQYRKGHLLFFEGANPTGVFCISSGTVKIYRMAGDGKVQIIKLAGAGDIVGHEAILSNGSYKYFAEVIHESVVCYIPKYHFLQMLKENHPLTTTLMQQISLELINSDKRTTSMATKPVRERVAEALLLLHDFFISKNKSGSNPDITLSREEIASYAGTATETAIRILSEFRNDNLIKLGKRSISILNETKLSKIGRLYES